MLPATGSNWDLARVTILLLQVVLPLTLTHTQIQGLLCLDHSSTCMSRCEVKGDLALCIHIDCACLTSKTDVKVFLPVCNLTVPTASNCGRNESHTCVSNSFTWECTWELVTQICSSSFDISSESAEPVELPG